MRRLPSILLLLSVTALGTGGLKYVHELEHRAADAARAEDGHRHGLVHDHAHGRGDAGAHGDERDEHGDPVPEEPGHHPGHDPANCFVHAQLNLPLHDAGYVPALLCVGASVPSVPVHPAPAVRSRRPTLLLDSRGPPAGASLPSQIVS